MTAVAPGIRWRDTLIVIAALLVIWEFLYLWVGETGISAPLETFAYIGTMAGDPDFWNHARITVVGFLLALFWAVAVGLPLGLWLGFHKLSGEVFTPLLVSFAAIPKITLYPIILLMFGLGMEAKVFFGAIHGVTPMAIFTMGAVSNIRPVLVKVGRVHNLSHLEIARTVLIPAALPEIFSGLRIAFSLTLIGTILGEMFAAQHGLGYLLMTSIGVHNVKLIMVLTLILSLFAAFFSFILLHFDRRLRARL
jgi:NitT/TauT family transport system permease protein